MLGLAFLVSVVMFFALRDLPPEHRQHVVNLFTWLPSGGLKVEFGFLADPLSIAFILFVTGVATLIHIYSIGYMHGDPRFSRFFAYMNLFVAAMLILVLGSSFLMTFLGWEGVGLCSYLLVAFWFERSSAAKAGKKAFITTRVGDVGFMIAMFLMFAELGSLNYTGANGAFGGALRLDSGTATAIALLLFLGAIGKSAQFPLHLWLPDAMEGPTPVSALIHAATMVTAGVFLVARAHTFFEVSGDAMTVVAWVGAATAFLAGTVALVQPDIKRVLAYSTISQLGYMFLALGRRRVRRRDLPGDHPRVLQGDVVPRCRHRDPRGRRQPGHADHGSLPQVHAVHRDRVRDRVPRHRRRAALRRVLGEGRRPREGVPEPTSTACGSSACSPRSSPART